jgi:hypothetical protein
MGRGCEIENMNEQGTRGREKVNAMFCDYSQPWKKEIVFERLKEYWH